MTEADYYYVIKRLGYRADQPVGKALYYALVRGYPPGPAGKLFSLPAHRLQHAVKAASEIEAHFTVTDEEAAGLSPNELLAYVRTREAPVPKPTAVTPEQLRAAGLSESQIKDVLSAIDGPAGADLPAPTERRK